MRRRRNPEVIAGRVNADGTIATGDGFQARNAGAGVYVLTFAPGFVLQGITFTKFGADTPWYISAISENSVTWISVSSIAAGGVNAAFMFTAVGEQR